MQVNRARIMEVELRMFWRMSRDIQKIRRFNKRHPRLRDLYDEADAMAANTDWKTLKYVLAKRLAALHKENPDWEPPCASSA